MSKPKIKEFDNGLLISFTEVSHQFLFWIPDFSTFPKRLKDI